MTSDSACVQSEAIGHTDHVDWDNASCWWVGLLDVDLCGPSIPAITGLSERDVSQASDGSWIPVYRDSSMNLAVMSIGFLLGSKNDAVIWRGPKKNAMIKQFIADVKWGELDWLVVDTPPGTSDEHISLIEALAPSGKLRGAVLVTTPQAIAVADVRREAGFCKKLKVPVLGVVENMSGYSCPHCQHCTNIFSSGGGEVLAEHCSVPFLGRVPIDPKLTDCMEAGENFLDKHPQSETAICISTIIDKIAGTVSNGRVLS